LFKQLLLPVVEEAVVEQVQLQVEVVQMEVPVVEEAAV